MNNEQQVILNEIGDLGLGAYDIPQEELDKMKKEEKKDNK